MQWKQLLTSLLLLLSIWVVLSSNSHPHLEKRLIFTLHTVKELVKLPIITSLPVTASTKRLSEGLPESLLKLLNEPAMDIEKACRRVSNCGGDDKQLLDGGNLVVCNGDANLSKQWIFFS